MMDPYADIADFYDMIYGTDIDYVGEVRGIHRLLGGRPGLRVIDVGCGTGCHLIHLAALGYRGVGIDRSEAMIGVAQRKTAAAGAPLNFVTVEANALQEATLEEPFDAAISCYMLGLGCEAREVEETIRRIHPFLAEGGRLVFNLMNAACGSMNVPVPDFYCDACCRNGRKAVWFYQSMTHGDRQQLTAVYLLDDGSGVTMACQRLDIALFRLDQVGSLLTRCGFEIDSVYGSISGLAPFRGNEPAMWLEARKV